VLLQVQIVRTLHPFLLPGIPSSDMLRRIGGPRLGEDHRNAIANLEGTLSPREVRVLAKAGDLKLGFFSRLSETMHAAGRGPRQLHPIDDGGEDTVASDACAAQLAIVDVDIQDSHRRSLGHDSGSDRMI
jgi:hypothetical protein